MESKKILKIVTITVLSLFSLFVIIVAGLWVYQGRSESMIGSEEGSGVVGAPDIQNGIFPGRTGSDGISYDEYVKQNVVTESSGSEDPSIIKTGYVNVAVDDIDATLKSLQDIRKQFDGSYVSMYDTGKGKDRVVAITIKVEVTKFEDLYNSIKELSGEFLSSSISENDVTETVQDLEARLKNYKSVEKQLLEILKSAKSVQDTLAVHKELNEVRMNIEMIETNLKSIASQTDYSYVNVYVTQSSTGAGLSDDQWRPSGVFKDAARALVEFGKFFVSALIWFVVFVPVVALVVVPVVLIQKRAKK